MNYRITTLLATVAGTALLATGAMAQTTTPPAPAPAAPAAPAASPAPYPAMSATLSANPNPATFEAGPLGKLTVTGVFSGGGFYSSNPGYDASATFGPVTFPHANQTGEADITNALAMVQTTSGPVQFFVAAGAYSLAALGAGYAPAANQDRHSFGFIPEGFVKIVPNSDWSIQAGLLPTVVGDEYTFSFENMNIQRGLLWNQENLFDKGVQVNWTHGSWAVSASWNDGFDSNVFNSMSGLVTYTFKNSDTLEFAATGALGQVGLQRNTFLVPIYQSNSSIYNLIYTHTQGPWTISPYFQFTSIASNALTKAYTNSFNGLPGNGGGSTVGGALLVKYSVTPEISLALRGEYITSSGSATPLYGPGSNAYSITFTPTYQKGILFVRGEVSYVGIGSGTPGFELGPNFTSTNQVRVAGEAGVMF